MEENKVAAQGAAEDQTGAASQAAGDAQTAGSAAASDSKETDKAAKDAAKKAAKDAEKAAKEAEKAAKNVAKAAEENTASNSVTIDSAKTELKFTQFKDSEGRTLRFKQANGGVIIFQGQDYTPELLVQKDHAKTLAYLVEHHIGLFDEVFE